MSEHAEDMERNRLHYGWIIILTGILVMLCALGLARFALGMLLPSMGADLGLSYSEMGLISTANFLGYMAGVAMAGSLAQRWGVRAVTGGGLALAGVSMLLISQAGGFWATICLYTFTGLGSALGNVPMLGTLSLWFTRKARGKAAGGMLSGNGLGILCSGLMVPWLLTQYGSGGWRAGWLVISIITLIVACLAGILLRNSPADLGLEPLGARREAKSSPQHGKAGAKPDSPGRTVLHLGFIYLIFGATYVVYATFIVTTLVDERGFGQDAAGMFWAVVGGLCTVSVPCLGWLSDKIGRKSGLTLGFAMLSLTYVLAAAGTSNSLLLSSVVLYGLTVFSVPTFMAAAVGDYLPPSLAGKAFGYVTLLGGAGQVGGPALAGYLADLHGGFGLAYWLCAAFLLCGIALIRFLKKPA